MNKHELASSLICKIFADRPSIQEAYDYATNVVNKCCSQDKIYVLTAIHVLMNTIANEIAKIEE